MDGISGIMNCISIFHFLVTFGLILFPIMQYHSFLVVFLEKCFQIIASGSFQICFIQFRCGSRVLLFLSNYIANKIEYYMQYATDYCKFNFKILILYWSITSSKNCVLATSEYRILHRSSSHLILVVSFVSEFFLWVPLP